MTTATPPTTTVRLDVEVAGSQLDTLRRTLSFLEDMRNAGWVVDVQGGLTATIRRAEPAPTPRPIAVGR
jgi:hypothetical protein